MSLEQIDTKVAERLLESSKLYYTTLLYGIGASTGLLLMCAVLCLVCRVQLDTIQKAVANVDFFVLEHVSTFYPSPVILRTTFSGGAMFILYACMSAAFIASSATARNAYSSTLRSEQRIGVLSVGQEESSSPNIQLEIEIALEGFTGNCTESAFTKPAVVGITEVNSLFKVSEQANHRCQISLVFPNSTEIVTEEISIEISSHGEYDAAQAVFSRVSVPHIVPPEFLPDAEHLKSRWALEASTQEPEQLIRGGQMVRTINALPARFVIKTRVNSNVSASLWSNRALETAATVVSKLGTASTRCLAKTKPATTISVFI
jgi:hypothetical protein